MENIESMDIYEFWILGILEILEIHQFLFPGILEMLEIHKFWLLVDLGIVVLQIFEVLGACEHWIPLCYGLPRTFWVGTMFGPCSQKYDLFAFENNPCLCIFEKMAPQAKPLC